MRNRSQETTGLLFGLAAYGTWGFFPLYFPLLAPASAYEVLAHRIIWSFLFMALVNAVFSLWAPVRTALRNPRTRRLLPLGAVLITINWGLYIWAVQHDHVVDAALGYFMNPLVTVAMGIIAFGERLRRAQWVALVIALTAIIMFAIDGHSIPWVGLVLAGSFGSYGLVKKLANVDAVASLTIETATALPFALLYMVWLEFTQQAQFLHAGIGNTLTLLTAGPVTAIPLLGFGAAAVRIPMSTLGLLQYITPVMQFMLGVFVFHEAMSGLKWTGFVWLWVGLVIFATDMVRQGRSRASDELGASPPD